MHAKHPAMRSAVGLSTHPGAGICHYSNEAIEQHHAHGKPAEDNVSSVLSFKRPAVLHFMTLRSSQVCLFNNVLKARSGDACMAHADLDHISGKSGVMEDAVAVTPLTRPGTPQAKPDVWVMGRPRTNTAAEG